MGLRQIDFHYRRRHLGGSTGITRLRGPVLAQRDDDKVLVADCPWVGPIFADPVAGRRGAESRVIRRAAPAAMRLWLWPDRPMRLLQQYDREGRLDIYRVDFATPPRRIGGSYFQTDLYLDLFATPSGDYAILDEDELAAAVQESLIDLDMQKRIFAQLAELVDLLEAQQLQHWLDLFCPSPFVMAALAGEPGWTYREAAPGEPDHWPQDE